MDWFYVVLLIPILVLILVWLLAWLCFRVLFIWLAKKLRTKFDLGLTIAHIHPTYLEGISIEKEGLVSVNIQHIGFSSKWINSQCNKPCTLYVGPFSVNVLKTIGRSSSSSVERSSQKKGELTWSHPGTINFSRLQP